MPELVPYTCPDCQRIVMFYPGFAIAHKGDDKHAFTGGSKNV